MKKIKDTPSPSKKGRLGLATLDQTQRTFARVMRKYYAGSIDHATFRNLVYAMSVYLSYLKEQNTQEITARIEAIEAAMTGAAK